MVCNEVRKDYLLNRWVVIATERCRRPTDFIKAKHHHVKEILCPLCVGNEDLTPPAVLLYLNENGKILKTEDNFKQRKKNWLIRIVPNLYPAFNEYENTNCNKKSNFSSNLINAIGHHEVIVESPKHNEDPSSAKIDQLINLINAYIDRLVILSSKPYVKFVSIFRNYGREAGASLTHAHSQIVAMPFVPIILREEIDACQKFYNKNKKCIFCDIIKKETKGPRLIFQNDCFIVFAPFASIQPLEFWIIPKRHDNTIINLTKHEIKNFAQTLKKSLMALKLLVNDPPYNFGFHLSLDKKNKKFYHWHLEVYPKLSIWAGFEKNTGVYINTLPPERAALELRKIIKNNLI